MIIVDVNLLLYAVFTGFPQHPRARRWWEQALNGSTDIGLTAPAVFGFLRLSTHPRVFIAPLPVDDAIGYIQGWLAQPPARFLPPGSRHLDIAWQLLHELGTAADLTTDVQLAASAIEYDAQLYSNDTDFARFSGLRVVNPLADGPRRQAPLI